VTEKHNFGEFIMTKRMDQGISLRKMAEQLEITAAYLCDLEKNRRQPPEKPLLDKMAKALFLTEDDRLNLYDMAGNLRGEVSPDLPEYIMDNDVVRVALRKAKDKNISEEAWLRFIRQIEEQS
jgi:transcriptional regulator with XRE-family HTH domain